VGCFTFKAGTVLAAVTKAEKVSGGMQRLLHMLDSTDVSAQVALCLCVLLQGVWESL
jgi:hypothetical protein